MSNRIRILIVDDQPMYRLGLRNLLETDPGLVVVADVSDGAEVKRRLRQVRPDVMLLNADGRRKDVLATLREVSSIADVRTVLVSDTIDQSLVMQALDLGARGCLLRRSASHLIVRCVHSVAQGQYWVGRDVVLDLVEAVRRQARSPLASEPPGATFRLTVRELEIVHCIVGGRGNREIAQKFAISEHTVKHHLTRIFDKTGASSRLELAVFALRHLVKRDDTVQESPVRTA